MRSLAGDRLVHKSITVRLMTNLSLPENNQSPFDAIRRTEKDGAEYWLATELLSMLGYKSWKRQKETVERAILSANNSGENAGSHFAEVVQMAQIGDSKAFREVVKDYKLTRYAAYLTAQNGDPRKPEIAAAQSYFATKTREAEIIIPRQNDELEALKLRVQLAEAERDAAIAQKHLLDTRKAITEMGNQTVSALILGATVITDKTPVEKVIDYKTGRTFEGVGITAIAQKLGFGKNTKACWQWLESIGYGKDSGEWELQLAAIEHHKLNSEAYEDILQKWNSGVRQRFIGE